MRQRGGGGWGALPRQHGAQSGEKKPGGVLVLGDRPGSPQTPATCVRASAIAARGRQEFFFPPLSKEKK